MCLIVDANCATHLCAAKPGEDAAPIVDWLERRGGKIVHGGKLTEELAMNHKVSRWLVRLTQAGRATKIPDQQLRPVQQSIVDAGEHRSDDPYVLALAVVSGARLLFSHDQDLHHDFCGTTFLKQPRGRVYQTSQHKHLLTRSTCQSS